MKTEIENLEYRRRFSQIEEAYKSASAHQTSINPGSFGGGTNSAITTPITTPSGIRETNDQPQIVEGTPDINQMNRNNSHAEDGAVGATMAS